MKSLYNWSPSLVSLKNRWRGRYRTESYNELLNLWVAEDCNISTFPRKRRVKWPTRSYFSVIVWQPPPVFAFVFIRIPFSFLRRHDDMWLNLFTNLGAEMEMTECSKLRRKRKNTLDHSLWSPLREIQRLQNWVTYNETIVFYFLQLGIWY